MGASSPVTTQVRWRTSRRLKSGGVWTMTLVGAVSGGDAGGVMLVAHATRFERYMDVQMDDLPVLDQTDSGV